MGKEDIIALFPLLLQGKATREQEQTVGSWLEESEVNQKIYQEYCATYYKLHYAQQWSKIDVTEATHRMRQKTNRRKRVFLKRYWFSGVAALFLICLGTFFFLNEEKQHELLQQSVVSQIRSGERKAMLTLANGKQVELSADHKVDMDFGTVRAVEDSAVGLVYQMKDSIAGVLEYHTLTVPRAGEYIMTLADGSKVWLNSESEIRYPVVFGNPNREVFITGEAFFEVTKDSLRPFIVHTSYTQTTVLGTSFNVMAYQDEQRTEITLVKGAVAVQAGTKQQNIHPGQQIRVNNLSMEMNCQEINANHYASWKEGVFDFEGMALEELTVKLSRWYDVDFFFVNHSAGGKKFTGAIKRNNSLQFMLDFIEKTSEVSFEIKGKVVRVYDR